MEIRPLTPKNPHDKREVDAIFADYHAKKNAKAVAEKQAETPRAPIPQAEPVTERLSSTDVTIQVNDVPSKMLPYPKGSSIKFKPYTFGDLQVFNSSTMSEEDQVKFILDGIITIGFDKANLAFQDFLFIAILRKLSAFSNTKFVYQFACEECGTRTEKEAELSQIEFKDLEIPSLPLIVDFDEDTPLYINPLTIGSSLKLKDVEKDKFLRAYAECIINMTPQEAYNLLKGATGEVIAVLQEVDKILAFGSQTISTTCPKCKKIQNFRIGDLSQVLAPFLQPVESIKSRIRFS